MSIAIENRLVSRVFASLDNQLTFLKTDIYKQQEVVAGAMSIKHEHPKSDLVGQGLSSSALVKMGDKGSNIGTIEGQACIMSCKRIANEKGMIGVQCTESCRPLVTDISELKGDYPHDVHLLQSNTKLYEALQKQQNQNPNQPLIMPSNEQMDEMVEVYSLPIATEVVPATSWKHALHAMGTSSKHMKELQTRWKQREQHYPPQAKANLSYYINLTK